MDQTAATVITDADRAEMRRRRSEGDSIKAIAIDYGIPGYRAGKICAGAVPVPKTVAAIVIAEAAKVFGLTIDDVLCTKKRNAAGIVRKARRAAVVVMRESCGMTWLEIAKAINRDNHTTVYTLVERSKTDRVAMLGVARIREALGMVHREAA